MSSPAATAYVAINALILIWDLVLAGRILNHRRGSPLYLALTALAALLTVPALVVAATSSTIPNGRDVHIIEWLWPLVLGVFALQAGVALVRHWTPLTLGIPVLLANLLVFGAAAMRFATTVDANLPDPIVALGIAHASVLAYVFGRSALWSPLLLQIPVLVPSYPAPHGWGRTLRAALALWCALTVLVLVGVYPGAVHSASTFAAVGSAPLRARPAGAGYLALGLRIFPDLDGPPHSLAARQDLAVADSLGAAALSVVVRPGMSTAALDSLGRVLNQVRSDSTVTLIVQLGYGSNDASLFRRDPDQYARTRLQAVGNVVRALRPDLLFPALDPWTDGLESLGTVPDRWWREALRQSASLAHRLDAGVRVGVSAAAFTAPDSTLFDWAAAADAPIDVLGISLGTSYGGGTSLVARFHAAARFMRGVEKPVWVFAAGASPRVFGERNQALALRATLVWAASETKVVGYIINGAGDYDIITGLRAPGGRLRPAVAMLARMKKAIEANQ